MKNLILKFVLLISLLGTTLAVNAGKPNRCPPAAQIKAVSLMMPQYDAEDDAYMALSFSKFGSNFNWAFGIEVPANQAVNAQDALNKANAALSTLSGQPSLQPYKGYWICIYQNSYGYMNGAISPVPAGM